jgi:hypothetical protein
MEIQVQGVCLTTQTLQKECFVQSCVKDFYQQMNIFESVLTTFEPRAIFLAVLAVVLNSGSILKPNYHNQFFLSFLSVMRDQLTWYLPGGPVKRGW